MNDTPDYILKLSALIVIALTECRVVSERLDAIENKIGIDLPTGAEIKARMEHHRQTILETLELRSPELAAHIALLFPDSSEA